MGKNNTRRPQARKTYSRLGANLVGQGVERGTYTGGRETRVVVRTPDTDE